MNARDKRRYDAFKGAQEFGDKNAGDFAPGSVATQNFAIIDQVIQSLDNAKAGQVASADTTMETLINAVKLDLQNIARTAAAIDQTEPGFADEFNPPKAYNPAALLTTADAFLLELAAQPADTTAVKAAKTALVAKFVAHELSPDFVAHLQADRQAIAAEQASMEGDSEDVVGSTASIGPLIRQGMTALNTLDAIMHNKYAGSPEKMAAWVSASHIERDPKRSAPAPTPAPQPAAVPAK